jgi:hypothetical protein
MSGPAKGKRRKPKDCPHDQVVLCADEGWFCMGCRKIVDHDCSYKEMRYRYGITGYRVASRIGHKYAEKYIRKERGQ